MKKKIFALTMVLGFIFGGYAFAWQDPCTATDNAYICEGYTLDNWVEAGPQFSPAPKCAGSVILWHPDGTGYSLDYIGINDTIIIAGIPCKVSNQGNLECKLITQVDLIFEQQE